MQKAYQDLDIQFLPDKIVTELNQQTLSTNISSISILLKFLMVR
jgi:hypothetical protein